MSRVLPAIGSRSLRRSDAVRAVGSLRNILGISVPGLVLATVLLWAVAPQWFTGYDPLSGDIGDRLLPPSSAHWFGTDTLGRDVYARVVHGTSVSIGAATIAILIAFVVSSILGLLAGYLGSAADAVIMRVVDVLLALPALLVSLLLVTILDFGTLSVAIAVGVSSIASFTRLLRGEVLKVRRSAFIEASQMYGLSARRIISRHVFPHARGPLLALVAIEFGSAILAISALSFLGYGTQPPTPEWGNLLADGRDYLGRAPWLLLLPGGVIVITIIAVNAVGHWINSFQTRTVTGQGRTAR